MVMTYQLPVCVIDLGVGDLEAIQLHSSRNIFFVGHLFQRKSKYFMHFIENKIQPPTCVKKVPVSGMYISRMLKR